MIAIFKSHVAALVVQAMLAGTLELDQADERQQHGEIRATWAGTAEIQLALDEEGEISFDSPFQLRLDGKVKIEAEHFQLQADRLSCNSAAGCLSLEAREADGVQLLLRTPGNGQTLHVVGRKLQFRSRDKRLLVEGAGFLRLKNTQQE